jgi:hypothetical protein
MPTGRTHCRLAASPKDKFKQVYKIYNICDIKIERRQNKLNQVIPAKYPENLSFTVSEK